MKDSLLYILISAMVLVFSACKDEMSPNWDLEPSLSAHYLRVSETKFGSSYAAAFSKQFTVESVGTSWKFSDVADWITLSPLSGSSFANVSLAVQENNSADNARSAIFYLLSDESDWDYNCALLVSQGAAVPTLSVNETSLLFSGGESTQTVGVAANFTWSASCSSSWVALSPDVKSGTLAISVLSNPQKTYRRSTIYIYYGSKSVSIDITQSPADISASAHTLEYENTASKYDIDIESETDWSAVASHSWISVTPDAGKAGRTPITIEVAPNTSISERNGYVAIKTGSDERMQIAIRQKGLYIEADEEIRLTSAEQSKKIAIKSNTNWIVTSKPDWITISNNAGENNGELLISVSENNSIVPRTGEIVLGEAGLSLECIIKVVQSGITFSTSNSNLDLDSYLDFTSMAGQKSFDIFSSGAWQSTQNVNWFTTTPESGRGDATITVTVEENNTINERVGTISYAYANQKYDVTVHQAAKYLNVDSKLFEFDSKGGTHTINLSTDTEWTAEIEENVSWLKLSQSSGSNNAVITLSAEDNPSVNPRSATVVINNNYAQGIRIRVSQKARRLAVSTQNVLFFANGGTSDVITIDTDGEYKLTSDASWMNVTQGAGNTFTVSVPENPTNDSRQGTITITLTDLKEGSLSLELKVLQAGTGGTFVIKDYTQDNNWDSIREGDLTLTIRGYTSDSNWDKLTNSSLTVKITGYSDDKNWNNSNGARGNGTR